LGFAVVVVVVVGVVDVFEGGGCCRHFVVGGIFVVGDCGECDRQPKTTTKSLEKVEMRCLSPLEPHATKNGAERAESGIALSAAFQYVALLPK
jgi:ribosome biogenesis SPOUT family RNA methylase Rps3